MEFWSPFLPFDKKIHNYLNISIHSLINTRSVTKMLINMEFHLISLITLTCIADNNEFLSYIIHFIFI
jgi:hypothetical protein